MSDNMLKIDLKPIIENVTDSIVADLESDLRGRVRRYMISHMIDGRNKSTEGLAHEIIRKKVEDFILSDKFEQMIQTELESQAQDGIAHAVTILLWSKSRKHLFDATQEKPSKG